MKYSKSGTTIIEAVIALVIIVIGIIGLYNINDKSQKLATSTENRIKAISIAREGIEVLQNIRDTNWIIFGSDTRNCWNSYNYDVTCLGNTGVGPKIPAGNYIIYKDIDNRWKLQSKVLVGDYSSATYRATFKVYIDTTDGLYTQSGGTSFTPLFTRVINISYPEDTNGDTIFNANDEKMLVKSIVSWSDNSKNGFYTTSLENLLTNWKRN
nr:hypothetical protein [Candidatus Gracilibacteria bacterium]